MKTRCTSQASYKNEEFPAQRVRAEIENLGYAECLVAFHPDIQTLVILLDEDGFPTAHTNGEEVAIVAPVEKFLSR